MSILWKIAIGSAELILLEDAGLGVAKRTLRSQAVDECLLEIAGDMTAGGLAYLTPIKIYRGAVCWFSGLVTEVVRSGDGSGEAVAYKVEGPWWYLENLVFLQEWKSRSPGHTSDDDVVSSRVVLNCTATGAPQSLQATVAEVIGYAAAQAGFAVGGVSLSTMMLWPMEMRDVTCAEVLRQLLRWQPDAVTWFDYASGTPTLHVARMGDLPSVSVDGADADVGQVSLRRLDAVKPPCVCLFYEWQHRMVNDSSETFREVRKEVAPVGSSPSAPGAVVSTIVLQGSRSSQQRQPVRVRPWPASPTATNALPWLKEHFPFLAEFLDADLEILDLYGEPNPPKNMERPPPVEGEDDDWDPTKKNGEAGGADLEADDVPNELVSGSIARWMKVVYVPLTVQARIAYHGPTTGLTTKQKAALQRFGPPDTDYGESDPAAAVSLNLLATSALSKDYSRLTEYQPPESIPAGIAAEVYASMSQTHYAGEITLVQEDCGGSAYLGKKLNVSGLASAWASMGALVQQVAEDVETGTTTIAVGPPEHLRPGDLVELLRASRTQEPAINSDRTKTKQDLSMPTIQGTEATPLSDGNSGGGAETPRPFTVSRSGESGEALSVLGGAYRVGADGAEVTVPATAPTAGTRVYLQVNTDENCALLTSDPVTVEVTGDELDATVLSTTSPTYVERSNILLAEVVGTAPDTKLVQRRHGNFLLGIWDINGYAARWTDTVSGTIPPA